MTVLLQLQTSLIDSFISLKNIRTKTLLWLAIYYSMGLLVFGFLVWQLIENQVAIKNSILDYLFPKSWHGISEMLADFLFESQAKTVLGNLVISTSFVLASVFLFPIKEKLSQVFEQESHYHTGKYKEFSLAQQAIEESKLLLFYFSIQSLILWIGYYPYAWSTWLSIILSYCFLFFTFGLDFISPTLQRHRTKYSVILKTLFKYPLIPVVFGALFSLPVILFSRALFSNPDNTFVETIGFIFIGNLLLLALAIPIGTTIANKTFQLFKSTQAPSIKSMKLFYALTTLILTSSLFLHSRLVISLHHKSQLLKAEYDIDWSSIQYELPSFSELTQGKAFSKLTFDMVVKNSTEFDVVVENSMLYITQKENDIATIKLSSFSLPSGETHRVKIDLGSNTNFSNLSEFNNLMNDWNINMEIDVWPGIPFVFNLAKTKH
ncbi:MAG: hypothetical protein ACJAS9_001065 [Polaribacter sp.]|jgi:hypothetical protein